MPIINFGVKILKFTDQGWTEFLGGQGVINKSSSLVSSKLDTLNIVNLKFFLFSFFGGIILILLILV